MLYRFDDCTLDATRRELRRGDALVDVEPQVFDLLEFLVGARDRVVSRDDLFAAIWQGRVVSDATLASRISSARAAIGDTGEDQRLIRTLPRKGFRFVGTVQEDAPVALAPVAVAAEPAAPAEPDSPSIAVLPFDTMSGDPGQDYFSDGVVEEIITALSQSRRLLVIARNSSFAYKGRSPDIRQVGRELGVRYVLEGSVRRAADRVRITGQLIDAATGAHLWAGRFDGGLETMFELQDSVASGVTGAILPTLEQAEIARARRKPTENLDAYDYHLRGLASVYRWTRAGVEDALALFARAIALDPDFAAAYGMAGWCRFWQMVNGWMTDRAAGIAEAAHMAERAAELGRDDAVALCFAGIVRGAVAGEVEAGITLIDRALDLNPNLAAAWSASGMLRTNLGDAATATEHLARAMRLSPLDPLMFIMQAFAAFAHFLAGRYDEAWPLADRACLAQPRYLTALRIAAASNAAAGRLPEARRHMARALELDPGLKVSTLGERVSTLRADVLARFVEALRLAGLPE